MSCDLLSAARNALAVRSYALPIPVDGTQVLYNEGKTPCYQPPAPLPDGAQPHKTTSMLQRGKDQVSLKIQPGGNFRGLHKGHK